MTAEQRYLQLVSGRRRGTLASLARAGLAAMTPAYAAAVRVRNWSFDHNRRTTVRLARPTISVGNLTVGGTGKTPVVAWLCTRLTAAGLPPAVLLRGYKAKGGRKGDEQLLLEQLLGAGVPVEADPNRSRAAARVLAQRPGAGAACVFVLDDGFQHRRVRRDVDLVLVDATRPFGFGRLLPRGLLREPLASLRRATAVIVTRTGLVDPRALEEVRSTIRHWTPAPIFACDFTVDRLTDASGADAPSIVGQLVLAVSGIGNPDAFARTTEKVGGRVVKALPFGDHHDYTPADVESIRAAAERTGATVLTTAKDWVKLTSLWPKNADVPIYVVRQRVAFEADDDARLMTLVRTALAACPRG